MDVVALGTMLALHYHRTALRVRGTGTACDGDGEESRAVHRNML